MAEKSVDFIHDLFPLKEAPTANSKYAWLHRLLKRKQRSKKNSHEDGHGDVQGSSLDESDPMDLDLKATRALARLDQNPAPCTNIKFPSHVSHLNPHLLTAALTEVKTGLTIQIVMRQMNMMVIVMKSRMLKNILLMQHILLAA